MGSENRPHALETSLRDLDQSPADDPTSRPPGPGPRAVDEPEAVSILNRTEDFQALLAERIIEAQFRTAGKRKSSR